MAKRKRKKTNRLFGITSRFLMLIVAGLLVLSYVSIIINPAEVWLISLVGLSFVPLSFANLVLLLWALKRRSKAVVIPLLALLPSLFFAGRYFRFQSSEQSMADDPTLKIMTYNVGRFAFDRAGASERKQCADSVFDFIKHQDADVICIQEFHVSDLTQIKSYLDTEMHGYAAEYYMFPFQDGSAFGNVTLSRIPVVGKGKIKFDESANLAIYTDYEAYGRRFRVYNCHFESYNISFTGMIRGLLDADTDIFTQTGAKMKKSITRRPRQVEQVFADIETCPVEAFVCGDFNDNPMSYSYYRLTRGRKDAFVEVGEGFGATYARLWPMIRIDYVLYPERFKAISHHIPRIPFSDHYPVITEIEL